MKKKYFHLDKIFDKYSLIALHSNLDDFSLAFLLNKSLGANFERANESIKYKNSNFEFFNWEDLKNGINCSLISNKNYMNSEIITKTDSLFSLSETKKVSLIESMSKVDYLIKIKQGLDLNFTLMILNKLPQIILSYTLDDEEIKSKLNLIFD
tara:strand:- start:655 stop:1113 length:459 start_codon:yes stop_codon:yes gene_type:complete